MAIDSETIDESGADFKAPRTDGVYSINLPDEPDAETADQIQLDAQARALNLEFRLRLGDNGENALKLLRMAGPEGIAAAQQYLKKYDVRIGDSAGYIAKLAEIYQEMPDTFFGPYNQSLLDAGLTQEEAFAKINVLADNAALMAAHALKDSTSEQDSEYPEVCGISQAHETPFERLERIQYFYLSNLGGQYDTAPFIENYRVFIERQREIRGLGFDEALNHPETRAILEKFGFDCDEITAPQTPIGKYNRGRAAEFLYDYQRFPDDFAPGHIDDALKSLYDKQDFNLRDYEGKTTDTRASLTAAWQSIDDFEHFVAQNHANPEFRVKTILDMCGGNGRSGIPYTYAGLDVTAFDISPKMVEDSKQRVEEDLSSGELRIIAEDAGLPVVDNASNVGKFNQVVGNFFDFGPEQFDQAFPGTERPQVITIMWHSLGFAGSPENIYKVLKNAYDILPAQGIFLVEMPDRDFGTYKYALDKFHDENPGYPVGSIIDAPSKKEGVATEEDKGIQTPRYFPAVDELYDLADRVGFVNWGEENYEVSHTLESGANVPVIKEKLYRFLKV